MRKFETWLAGLLWIAVVLLLPMAALEPATDVASRISLGACADGAAHLAMGCASVQL